MGNAFPCFRRSAMFPESPTFFDSIKGKIQQVHPTEQIEPLISFIENQLQRITDFSAATPSSSSILNLDSAASITSLGADFMNIISTKARRMGTVTEIRSLVLSGLKKVGEDHWILLGLSVVAYALERYVTMKSNVSNGMELLVKIFYLSKDLKRFKEAMPRETEMLRRAVQIIAEGAIICCDYINKGRLSWYWSAEIAQTQLEKTTEIIQDMRSSLGSDSFADDDLSKHFFSVYSMLTEQDQETFLDICIYFNGWEWNLVSTIIDEDRLVGLQSEKLIRKDDSGVVIVNGILRSMGETEAKRKEITRTKKTSKVVKKISQMVMEISGILLDIDLFRNSALNTEVEQSNTDSTEAAGEKCKSAEENIIVSASSAIKVF